MIKLMKWIMKNPAEQRQRNRCTVREKDKRCFFSSFRRFLYCKCPSVVGKRLDVFLQATKRRASFITGIREVTCYFWFNCFCQNKVKRKICQICHIVKFAVNMITNAPGAKKWYLQGPASIFITKHLVTKCMDTHHLVASFSLMETKITPSLLWLELKKSCKIAVMSGTFVHVMLSL